MRADLKPGNQFPDFELPDQDGGMVRLSDFMGGKPLALTFNRGNY
jgi:peroxiredoxin